MSLKTVDENESLTDPSSSFIVHHIRVFDSL